MLTTLDNGHSSRKCSQAPAAKLGTLSKTLEEAPAAFPTLLQIGQQVMNGGHDHIYSIRTKIEAMVGSDAGQLDSHLMTQFAISVAMAQKVSMYMSMFLVINRTMTYICTCIAIDKIKHTD